MKKIIFFILLLSTYSYAQVGVESTVSYECNNKVTFEELNLHYTYGTSLINVIPYIGQQAWFTNNKDDKTVTTTYVAFDYSIGCIFNWKHLFLGSELSFIYANDKDEVIWEPDFYWITNRSIPIYVGCVFENILDTGMGFKATFATNTTNKISYTELVIRYRYLYDNYTFGLYGKQKCWFVVKDKDYLRGSPYLDMYTVGTEIAWKGIFIYYEHTCCHDVYSNPGMWKDDTYTLKGVANRDCIGVRFIW